MAPAPGKADVTMPEPVRAGCCVELLGPARLLAGVKAVWLEIGPDAALRDVLVLLAARHPALVDQVIDLEREQLVAGYVVNRNGRDFITSLDAPVRAGDHLLLLASSAGG